MSSSVLKFDPHTTKIAIIGLGYVGLPLAVEFAKKFRVIGFDTGKRRINELNKGDDRTLSAEGEALKDVVYHANGTGLHFTDQVDDIAACNFYIVTVPTPVDEINRPDLTHLYKASETVGKVLKKGDIVIYESTVYPGATEEECVPVMEKASGLKFNTDF